MVSDYTFFNVYVGVKTNSVHHWSLKHCVQKFDGLIQLNKAKFMLPVMMASIGKYLY